MEAEGFTDRFEICSACAFDLRLIAHVVGYSSLEIENVDHQTFAVPYGLQLLVRDQVVEFTIGKGQVGSSSGFDHSKEWFGSRELVTKVLRTFKEKVHGLLR